MHGAMAVFSAGFGTGWITQPVLGSIRRAYAWSSSAGLLRFGSDLSPPARASSPISFLAASPSRWQLEAQLFSLTDSSSLTAGSSGDSSFFIAGRGGLGACGGARARVAGGGRAAVAVPAAAAGPALRRARLALRLDLRVQRAVDHVVQPGPVAHGQVDDAVLRALQHAGETVLAARARWAAGAPGQVHHLAPAVLSGRGRQAQGLAGAARGRVRRLGRALLGVPGGQGVSAWLASCR